MDTMNNVTDAYEAPEPRVNQWHQGALDAATLAETPMGERDGRRPMNPLPIEITVFKKSAGVLSKTIAAAADGSPVPDGSACFPG